MKLQRTADRFCKSKNIKRYGLISKVRQLSRFYHIRNTLSIHRNFQDGSFTMVNKDRSQTM